MSIRYIAEQDGTSEREFKRAVVALLKRLQISATAYLVQIDRGQGSTPSVALCIATAASGTLQKLLTDKVTFIFANMFSEDEHLDIVFVDRDARDAIEMVSVPFYVA